VMVGLFALAIFAKLSGKLKEKYVKWGYGTRAMYALAAIETLGVVGLFTIYKKYAIMILAVIIMGAFLTLIRNKENWKSYILPIAASILIAFYILLKSGRLLAVFLE